jgi:sRNA-binding protein
MYSNKDMEPLAQENITEARIDLPQGGNLLYDRSDVKNKKRKEEKRREEKRREEKRKEKKRKEKKRKEKKRKEKKRKEKKRKDMDWGDSSLVKFLPHMRTSVQESHNPCEERSAVVAHFGNPGGGEVKKGNPWGSMANVPTLKEGKTCCFKRGQATLEE